MAYEKTPVNYMKDNAVGEFIFTRVENKTTTKSKLGPGGNVVRTTRTHILFCMCLDKGSVSKDVYSTDYDPSADVIIWGTTIPKVEEAPRGMRDFIPYSVFKAAFRFAARKGLSTGTNSLPLGTCFVRVKLGTWNGEAKNSIGDIGGEEIREKANKLAEASASLARSIMDDINEEDDTGENNAVHNLMSDD